MADTRVQRAVATWIRENWLPKREGQSFDRTRVKLKAGGEYLFDAVSEDGLTVVSVATSRGPTATGKHGSGKLNKLRSDVLFLLMAQAPKKLLCLTERDMFDVCQKEFAAGRLPKEVEILLATIPPDLDALLKAAREAASKEVLPPQM